MTTTETHYDFRSKYTQQNLVTRGLLSGFFRALEALVAESGVRSGKALEVGCGEGFSTERLRRALPPAVSLSALDIEARLIAEAKVRNPAVPITQGSIYDLQVPARSVDLVVSLEVLEHLDRPADGMRALVRTSSRFLIVSTPREPLWRAMNFARGKYVGALGNTPGHLNHWSRRELVSFVASFATVRAVRSPLPWTFVLAEVRP